MTTPVDFLPKHSVGMIGPRHGPFMYYQFYQIFPPNSLFITGSLDLGGFSAAAVDRALASYWSAFDYLRSFHVEQIVSSGVPLSAYAGRARMVSLLEESRRRAEIPISTDFEDVIAAVQTLRLKRVAVAAKWAPDLMAATATYLADAGVEVAGVFGDPHTIDEVHALNIEDSIGVATGVGRRALRETPDADGLLLLGGGWLVLQAVLMLEREFGKPVITNPGALYWAALRRSGLKPVAPEAGTLLNSLR